MCNAQYTIPLFSRARAEVLIESISAVLFPRKEIECYGPCSVQVTQRKSKTQCPGLSQTFLKSDVSLPQIIRPQTK